MIRRWIRKWHNRRASLKLAKACAYLFAAAMKDISRVDSDYDAREVLIYAMNELWAEYNEL